MRVSKNLVPSSKYNIKCPYAMNPKFLVVHNTANNASAKNEIAYMIRNNNQVSFHYAIDDKEVVQGIPENRNAWHAGDGGSGNGNRNGISIEICYSKSGGEKFNKAEKNAAKFIAKKLKEKGWGIDKVKKHQDFSSKYCPHRTLNRGWERFLNMIKEELNSYNNKDELYRVRKSWSDSKGQIGAFKSLDNAVNLAKKNNAYKVYNSKGVKVYPTKKSAPKPKRTWEYYITGKDVKDLQSELNKQFNKNIKVDGYFGDRTIAALVTVRKGAKGNLTKIIQRRLRSKGFNPSGGVDGIFGNGTYNKVRAFQRKYGLAIDGIVGRETWKALYRN